MFGRNRETCIYCSRRESDDARPCSAKVAIPGTATQQPDHGSRMRRMPRLSQRTTSISRWSWCRSARLATIRSESGWFEVSHGGLSGQKLRAFAASFARTMRDINLTTPAGLYLGKVGGFTPNWKRLERFAGAYYSRPVLEGNGCRSPDNSFPESYTHHSSDGPSTKIGK